MEMTELIKSVKDATDALKSAHADNEERTKKLVEETIKGVLSQHPGITPARTLPFAGSDVLGDDLVAEVPVEVQREMDKVFLVSSILRKSPKELKIYPKFRKMFEAKAQEFMKALDSTTAGGVDEWVPTELSPNLIEKVRLQLKVAALFPLINMPTNPYKLPIDVGDFTTFKVPENTADTGQTDIPVGDTGSISGDVTFTAVGHKSIVLSSKEATEDSIIPLLPLIERKLILSLAQGREDAILNGDTGTHEDTDTTSATSRRKMFLGLRAMANDNSATHTFDLATMSINNLLAIRELMGVYGVNPSDIAWVTSIKGMMALAKIDALQTLDKVGPQAVILAGQLGTVLGSPLIVSEYVRNDLNASGIYEASATKTVLHCVHRNGFGVGERRRPSTEFLRELYARYDQNATVVTERIDFQPLFPIASNVVVANGLNVE